ncbi:MAG: AAA family ATPase [Alphaproteobacteria bacterium]|nr:AAA family ATPase [Alphaproteobacteria bacterium]
MTLTKDQRLQVDAMAEARLAPRTPAELAGARGRGMTADRDLLAPEMAVLGALLSDNAAMSRIEGVLEPDDFLAGANGKIFDVVRRLISEGRVADGVTLREHFEREETIRDIGGVRYLADLLGSAAFGPEIADYAELVRYRAHRRRIIEAGREMTRLAETSDAVGRDDLDGIITGAQRVIDRALQGGEKREFVRSTVEAVASVTRAVSRKGTGISTGLPKLDRKIGGLFPGDLIVIAARPSMGKTQLASVLANSVADQPVPEGETGGMEPPGCVTDRTARNRVVGFFSLEMDRAQISQRGLSSALFGRMRHRLPYSHMRNGWIKDADVEAIKAVTEQMSLVMIDDRAQITIGYLRERMTALKRQYGRLDLVVIDYLQLMDKELRRQETDAAGIGRITMKLKTFAKEFGCPIVVLSQLSREVEKREDKRPQLSDLRDSGSIEQDADIVLFVYRAHYYLSRQGEPKKAADKQQWQQELDNSEPHFDVIAAKLRAGAPGDVRLYWDAPTGFIANEREDVS